MSLSFGLALIAVVEFLAFQLACCQEVLNGCPQGRLDLNLNVLEWHGTLRLHPALLALHCLLKLTSKQLVDDADMSSVIVLPKERTALGAGH